MNTDADSFFKKLHQVWTKIQEQSDRIIQFVDFCGHEKYLKTTIFGLVGLCPDYALVVVNANAGLQRMTREHIGGNSNEENRRDFIVNCSR